MLGSSNNFFYQSKEILIKQRSEVENILSSIHGYDEEAVKVYLKAYDYFCKHFSKFDGSTFSKDLFDIYPSGEVDGLDLDAMLHDYFYIHYKVKCSYSLVSKADKIFVKEIKLKNKSQKDFKLFTIYNFYSIYKLTWLRFIRPFYTPYSYLRFGKVEVTKKKEFLKDYLKLKNNKYYELRR